MIGIIGGTSLFKIQLFEHPKEKIIKTEFGSTHVIIHNHVVFIPRHGIKKNIPPHKINHKANISAFKNLGVENIVSITSVGSLKKKIKPGMILIPDDYINLWNIPTIFDDEIYHITPSLDKNIRKIIISTAKNVGMELFEKGIYIQTKGPRLETRAEINFLKSFGDIVGMTMASETTLAKELELNYANISTIENYCHGITDKPLSMDIILKNAKQNSLKVKRLILAVIENLKN